MEQALGFCQARGGSLLKVDSLAESKALQRWWEEKDMEGRCGWDAVAFWLGTREKMDEVDSRKIPEYTNWFSNLGDKDCAVLMADPFLARTSQTENFRWMDVSCSSGTFPFSMKFTVHVWTLCERQVDFEEKTELEIGRPVDVDPDGCLPGWTRLGAEGCYKFLLQPSTAAEAQVACDKAGGYLVEMDSEQEFHLLRLEWLKTKENTGKCHQEQAAYWIGVSDGREEGRWRLGRSGLEVTFARWNDGEPNNWGPQGRDSGGVPGEDCVLVALDSKEDNFQWYDAPCGWRGAKWGEGALTVNPLCEQKQGLELEAWMEDGIPETRLLYPELWLSVEREGKAGSSYIFMPVPEGVTKQVGESMCQNAGGTLATPSSAEEWKELQDHIQASWHQTSLLDSVLNGLGWGEEGPRYGWWLGATDQGQEGVWRWTSQIGSGENITFSDWYDGAPFNHNRYSFGGADCAAVVSKEVFQKSS